MKILTFDTSLNKTYITLSESENIIDSRILTSTEEKYHSAYLIPVIVDILKQNNLTMQDINAIGTNIGPGSFTGIRVCNTIARVFAQELNIKLLGFSSLQILSKINKKEKDSIILLDARKNKVYSAIYSHDNEELKIPSAIEKEDVLNIDSDKYEIIADSSMAEYLGEKGKNVINYEKQEYELGKFLAELTFKTIKNNPDDFNWAKIKPLYIQPPSISKPKAR